MSSSEATQAPTTNSTEQPISQPDQEEHDQHKPMLALPAAGSFAPQLEVNGQDLKLDALGPVVVNEDGTMSRIDNWHEMTEIERNNVRRILLKRNAHRLERLRAKRDQELAAEAGTGSAETEGTGIESGRREE
ncbi:hypothetical protein BGX34_009145 [Mortierella sp. NVP85]|nr:hypothetical protein BGX34_009145 [Mortierella sp. NVP85]